MKILNSITAILIILSFSLAGIAFSAEPQMMLYTQPTAFSKPSKINKERKIASLKAFKNESLKKFEINNNDMIKLFAFKSERKASRKIEKKIEKKIERNLDKNLFENLTVEAFAEVTIKKEAHSL